MMIGLGLSLTCGGRVPLLDPPFLLTGASNGFYYDFTAGATGAGIASVTSAPPSTVQATQGTAAARPVWTDAVADYAAFDGSDDGLQSTLVPTASMTLALCFRAANNAAAQIAIGATDASSMRCQIGVNTAGQIAGGWATQTTNTIKGSDVVAGGDVVGLLRANASVVELWQNGVRVYQAAPSGSPNTTAALSIGANAASGTVLGIFLSGRVYRAFAVQQFIADVDVVPLMRSLGMGVVAF